MMKILLCGGGNAIHVLSSYCSARDDTHVTVLSLFPGEADKLRAAIPDEGIRCINDIGEDVYGKPNAVISKAEDVPKDLDIVVFALPSFTVSEDCFCSQKVVLQDANIFYYSIA